MQHQHHRSTSGGGSSDDDPPTIITDNNVTNSIRRSHHVRLHSLDRCLLHLRSEVLWDGVVGVDLLNLRRTTLSTAGRTTHAPPSSPRMKDDELQITLTTPSSPPPSSGTSPASPLKLSPSKDDSYALLSPWILHLAHANQSLALTLNAWMELSQALFHCSESCARMYFETFIMVHGSSSSKTPTPSPSSSKTPTPSPSSSSPSSSPAPPSSSQVRTHVDLCEFLLYLYLQQHWPKYQRNYRSINRARHQMPASPLSPGSPTKSSVRAPHSPIDNNSGGAGSGVYNFSLGNSSSDSNDERKDIAHLKSMMMDMDVGVDVEGETEAEETFEEMTHFLRLHLTNILCLLKDPAQVQIATANTTGGGGGKYPMSPGGGSGNSSPSGSAGGGGSFNNNSESPLRSRLAEFNAAKKSNLPPPHGDALAFASVSGGSEQLALITLQSHEFDRLAFLLTFNHTAHGHQRLSQLTPFWRSHPYAQVSVATLRDWVLRFVHPLPLTGVRPHLASSGAPVVWTCAYPNITIGLLSRATQETVMCDDSQLKCGDFHLKDCTGCTVVLTGRTRFVSVTRCTKCTINVGVVGVLLRVEDCQQLVLTGTALHVRVTACTDSTLYLFTGTQPVLVGRNTITLAPHNKPALHITQQLRELGVLTKHNNQWLCAWDEHCWMRPRTVVAAAYDDNNSNNNNNNSNYSSSLSRPNSGDGIDDVLMEDMNAAATIPPAVTIMAPDDFALRCEFGDEAVAAVSSQFPLPLPRQYLSALAQRRSRVTAFRQRLADAQFTEADRLEIRSTIGARFQTWLKERNGGADLRYVNNLKKLVKSLESQRGHEAVSPAGSPRKLTPARPFDPTRAQSY